MNNEVDLPAAPTAASASAEDEDAFDAEVFEGAQHLECGDLPIVVFSDDARQQKVWYYGSLRNGKISSVYKKPDVRAKDPVVMSPAYLGFTIEPYEPRYLHYGGVGMVFERPRGGRFMQPSIDTILVCCALRRFFLQDGQSVRRAVDVGSGSGFLGKFVAAHAPGTGAIEVTLVDIDPCAKQFCESAGFNGPAAGRHKGRHVKFNCVPQDAVAMLEQDADYDLVVTNPPYVPTKAEVEGTQPTRPVSGFWEGVGLVLYLMELLVMGKFSFGAHLVMMVTSLTLKAPQVREALQVAQHRGCQVKVLDEREIAWKTWYAGPRDLDYLLATDEEFGTKCRLGACEFFVGATRPGSSRTKLGERDFLRGYHWQFAYVLDVSGPQ